MISARSICVGLGLAAATAIAIAACNSVPGGPQGSVATTAISSGRQNAARVLSAAGSLTFTLRQQILAVATQVRCDPLDLDSSVPGGAHTAWATKIGPVTFTPDFPAEYDILQSTNETDYCLGIRAVEPSGDPNFSAIEFSLRAVNPYKVGHAQGFDFGFGDADYPSNDDVAVNRSLIDMSGGDVAIEVSSLDFNFSGLPTPSKTKGYMNGLGETAWVLFMRDNCLNSGRFYNINGVSKGGPRALLDTPSPLDDGFFQSAQVRGTQFDALSEPFFRMNSNESLVCNGVDAPSSYAFMDKSAPGSPGPASFLLVIRREAFHTAELGGISRVVVDPSGPPATVAPLDLMDAPNSGYNEGLIPLSVLDPTTQGATRSNHGTASSPGFAASGNGPQGVHEIGFTVFFVTSAP